MSLMPNVLFLRPQSGNTWTGAPLAEAPGGGREIERGRGERDVAKAGAPAKSAAAQRAYSKSQMGGK